MRYLKPLATLLVVAAFPAAALASKPATPSQRSAILAALGNRAPARCLTARISTANASFAEVYFTGLWGSSHHVPSGCQKFAANGVTILRLRAGHWHAVTAGSDFATPSGGCRVPHVPKSVVADFHLCGSLTPHAAAAETMTAPSRARVGARITVHGAGLKSGRYTLLLVRQLSTQGATPTDCSARVGSAQSHAGTVTISGSLPHRLTCRMAEGPSEGTVSVRPGKYVLSLGILIPPAGFREGTFVKRNIQLTS